MVLDGEIVCVDDSGRPQFSDLLSTVASVLLCFDLLIHKEKDCRSESLLESQARASPSAGAGSCCILR